MKPYKQLTYDLRCQIYVLKQEGYSQQAIADAVSVNQSTISRELRRNKGKRGYRHKQAHNKSCERRKSATKRHKMTPDNIALIEARLRQEWSPEQISGWLNKEHNILISLESIYLHVWDDKHKGGDLYKHLRHRVKGYRSRKNSASSRGKIKNRVSIQERPAEVDDKERIGDWEIDLMIGKDHSGAMVTIVERVSKFTVSAQVNDKSAATVTAATIALLEPYRDAVLTITADNGKEFAYHEQMTAALDAQVYFADPYSSWQRGLNENTNGLLRQYWPKNTDFRRVMSCDIDAVLQKLNNRPRKLLNYQLPSKIMQDFLSNRAA
jgi:IS30 family transposase